ncbi:alcohol dehydrogenase [Xylanibacillus composti]|uniref:Alcohol dehydrogenase n=1 Tax=Xylanibacillus composti TaxID=1572762 RepID=A0A8J4H2Y8_9BACL|nr:nucleotidyltransferase family protein [Xylanibacillus composti]GIQ69988.1 alcohol dehydrogenase [Xylanibacillus composti]
MNSWTNILINPNTSILQVMKTIDDGAMQIALVVDEHTRLLGTVTDGDIRRGILNGQELHSPVSSIMNRRPLTVNIGKSKQAVFAMMKKKHCRQIPVLDDEGRVVGIELLDQFIRSRQSNNFVVIMAGGLGTRLKPLTDECPKPLLHVGNRPLLETIIENFIDQGFYRFYVSVNYKADMIKDYFGDGAKWGVEIQYLHETERLGTAGALSLLPEKPKEPILVMNGDLLTKINFQHLLDFHQEQTATATMCVREYNYQIPYGVIKMDQDRLIGIEEKPVQKYFVNGGIYVLSPEALGYVPVNQYYDMPTLFDLLISQGNKTTVFPIREYWMDIGRMDDFNRANGEYSEIFG